MNASPYHSKVRVSLKFADTQFAAGGSVTGKMELECKAEKGLGIGVIMVELYAIEGTQRPLQSCLCVLVRATSRRVSVGGDYEMCRLTIVV